jgi:hypothetical protein
MQKILGAILGILIVLVAGVVLAKDIILKTAIEQSVTHVTGFKTTIHSLKYNLPSTIHIEGLQIRNPQGFEAETLIQMPEIFAHLELQQLLSSKKIHLPEVRLNIQEVHIEKNPQGVSNIELLSSVGGKQPTPAKPAETKPAGEAMPFQLDKLVLTIRNVTYADRSGLIAKAPLPGKALAVDLNVQEEVFTNITDPKMLVNLILVKILNSATLGRILNIDPKQLLGDNAAQILNSGQQVLNQQVARVGALADQATTQVLDNQVTKKAEALVGSSATEAKKVLGSTTGAAKEQVSGLFGKIKSLQPGDSASPAPAQ